MLDAFLEVLVEKEARHSAREEMADAFMALPVDELHKIASGHLKLADHDDHEWLSKFKGTPLYEPALQLEQQCLELDIQQQQQQQARQQETEQDRAVWNAKDGIRLKKRMLDLELLKMESSTEAGGNIASGAPPTGAPDMQQEQAAAQPNPQGVAGAPMENVPKTASVRMAKIAAELQAGQREDIKGKNFAVHPKGDDPKYPIHDASHARNALTRVRQFGTPAEKAQVFAAITKKYPALATRSDVIPEKQQAKAEKKLGLSKGGESSKQEAPKQKLAELILSMRMEKVALSSTTLGALAGGGLGAATGLLGSSPDAQGQTHRLRNALLMGGMGAGVGAAGGASLSALRKAEQGAAKGVAAQAAKGAPATAAQAAKAEHAAATLARPAAQAEHATAEMATRSMPTRSMPTQHMPTHQMEMPLHTSELQVVPPLPTARIHTDPTQAMSAAPAAAAAPVRKTPPRNPARMEAGGSIMDQMYAKGNTVAGMPAMTSLASARFMPPDILVRMQKTAAMEVADSWGRQMAQMEKEAIGLSAVTGALKGFGGRALTAAKANPKMLLGAGIGAGAGALGGAATAEPGHRLSGALKGGVLGGAVGGAAGYAVPKVQSAMKGGGQSFGQAMKDTGQQAWGGIKDVVKGPQAQAGINFGKGGIGNVPLSATGPTGTIKMPVGGGGTTVMPAQGSLFG